MMGMGGLAAAAADHTSLSAPLFPAALEGELHEIPPAGESVDVTGAHVCLLRPPQRLLVFSVGTYSLSSECSCIQMYGLLKPQVEGPTLLVLYASAGL
jgi:hypothetical protein